MATWSGSTLSQATAIYAGLTFGNVGRVPAQGYLAPTTIFGANNLQSPPKPPIVPETWKGQAVDQSSALYDWFEDFHVIPRSFDLGNILSDQSTPIEVFSAFRRVVREWVSFTNNGGAGIELGSAPALPVAVDPLSGYVMTLEVAADGAAIVDSTLDFEFEDSTFAIVPIELQRIVLFGAVPEEPFTELLAFRTDVISKAHGHEQRFGLRKSPRRNFQYSYILEEGYERQFLENLMFDWQSRVFGVPVWWEGTALTAAALTGDTVLNVGETDYRSFQVGGLALVYVAQGTFDVAEIASITSTTITLISGILQDHAEGVLVFPLAVCRMQQSVGGSRYVLGLGTLEVEWRDTSAPQDLADLTPFDSHDGKLLVTENLTAGLIVDQVFERRMIYVDNETGVDVVFSPWDVHRRSTTLILRARGLQAAWELRGLAYALRGRQVSFFLVRGADDLTLVASLASGTDTMDVTNFGYAQFVRERQPKNLVRISFVDGSTPLIREIIGSAATSATVEQLTLSANWPASYTVDEIERVEFVEKVRFDTDDLRLEFARGGSTVRLVAPVKTVLE